MTASTSATLPRQAQMFDSSWGKGSWWSFWDHLDWRKMSVPRSQVPLGSPTTSLSELDGWHDHTSPDSSLYHNTPKEIWRTALLGMDDGSHLRGLAVCQTEKTDRATTLPTPHSPLCWWREASAGCTQLTFPACRWCMRHIPTQGGVWARSTTASRQQNSRSGATDSLHNHPVD